MSRFRRVVPVVLLLVLIPASASAQGLFRWLGKLSGPGPFWGTGLEVRVKCLGVDKEPTIDGEGVEREVQVRTMGPVFRVPCDTTLDDRHAAIYLKATGSIAENNPLFYGDIGQQQKSTAVRLATASVSVDWTWARPFDVGTGGGVMYFAGPRFANFSRLFLEPVRLTARPLVWPGTDDENGWFLLSLNWQILLGEIDGADFGAPLDPLRERNEHIVVLGASIDVIRFVKRFKIGQPKP